MKKAKSIHEAADLVREYIKEVDDFGSQYFVLVIDEDEDNEWTIRVSDHSATASNAYWRNNGKLISFVRKWNRQSDGNIENEFVLDENNNLPEYEGYTIEDIINDVVS
jgi:hypothetical protein